MTPSREGGGGGGQWRGLANREKKGKQHPLQRALLVHRRVGSSIGTLSTVVSVTSHPAGWATAGTSRSGVGDRTAHDKSVANRGVIVPVPPSPPPPRPPLQPLPLSPSGASHPVIRTQRCPCHAAVVASPASDGISPARCEQTSRSATLHRHPRPTPAHCRHQQAVQPRPHLLCAHPGGPSGVSPITHSAMAGLPKRALSHECGRLVIPLPTNQDQVAIQRY